MNEPRRVAHKRAWGPAIALLALLGSLMLGGCATAPPPTHPSYDPWEPFNRDMYQFNDSLDRHIMKPAADAYVKVTPSPVRRSIRNFFDNAAYPNVVVNDLLQGEFKQGMNDTTRFLVNSTLGIGGLFDLVPPANNNDTGITLAHWGVPAGPYLVLPFLGPYTTRDTPDIPVSLVTNALFYISNPAVTIPLTVLNAISYRASQSQAIEMVRQSALDPYLFVREAYLQRRNFLIYKGNPPLQLDTSDLPGGAGAAPANQSP